MPFIGKENERIGGRRFVSMRVKFVGFLCAVGLSVIAAALILIPLVLSVFRTVYMRPALVSNRMDRYVESFATYVADKNVRSDDTAAVVKWTRHHRSVYLTVFSDTDENFGAAGGELLPDGSLPDMEPFFDKILPNADGSYGDSMEVSSAGTLYTVLFADGHASVAVVDYSLSTASDVIIFGGLILAIAVFFVVVLVYYHIQTRAIVTLAREVEAVSNGALNSAIVADRNDEIGLLARDVNIMRNTIIEKMEEQTRAWQANSDLLTSMTHDLRTPLTTLLGYLELLSAEREGEGDNLTEEQRAYLRVCTTKVEQIKELSDKLFHYFWAYNRSDREADPEPFDAALLFGQLFGDYIPAMEAAGLTVIPDMDAIPAGATVRVRPDCLRRVTDNLFDNLVKYADPAEPVTVTASVVQNHLILRMENKIAPISEKNTSTRIGHKTCHNMMELMHGTFRAQTDGNCFIAELSFPL